MQDKTKAKSKEELERLLSDGDTPLRESFRARLVIATLSGKTDAEVADELGASAPTVSLWRRRFEKEGAAGLRDRPRSGRPRLRKMGSDGRVRASVRGATSPNPELPEGNAPPAPKAASGAQKDSRNGNSPLAKLSDATLEMLLEVACRTIARRGFGETRVADIAKDARVSPATIHYYFQTKEEILLQALLWANSRLTSHLEAISSGAEDPLERLARFIERTIPFPGIRQDEYLLEIDLWSRTRSHPELLHSWEGYVSRWNEHVEGLVRAGIDRGHFRRIPDPDQFVVRLAALTDGLAAPAVIGSEQMPPSRVREIVLRFVSNELGVELGLLDRLARLPDM